MIIKVISIALFSLLSAVSGALSFLYLRFRKAKEESETENEKREKVSLRGIFDRNTVICISLFSLLSLVLGVISFDNTTSLLNFYRVAFVFVSAEAIAITDFKTKIIPNLFVLITLAGGTVFHIVDIIISSKDGQPLERMKAILISNVLIAVIAVVILCVLSALTHSGMGFGDIKYLGAMCYVGGAGLLLFSLSFALVSSLVVSIVLIAAKKKGKKDLIPFGPFITFGVVVCIFTGLM